MTSLEELEGPSPIEHMFRAVAENINPIPQTETFILPQKEFARRRTIRSRVRNAVNRVRGKFRSKANVKKQRAARKAAKKARKADAAARKAQQQNQAGKKPSARTAKDALTNAPDNPTKPKDGTPGKKERKTQAEKDAKAADAETKKKSWMDRMAAIGPAGLLAIGLTMAVATKIAADTAASYANCELTDITIKKIEPKLDWGSLSWLLGDKSSKVTVTFTASNSYEPLADSDVWTIRGTGQAALDDKQFKLIKVNDDGTVVIGCGQSDCSKIKASSGSADTQCDFGDRANKAVEDNASDFGSAMSRLFKGFFSGLMVVIPIILFCIAAYFFIKFAMSLRHRQK